MKCKLIVIALLAYTIVSCSIKREDAIGTYNYQTNGAVLNLRPNGYYSFVTLRGDTICADKWEFDKDKWTFITFFNWKDFTLHNKSKTVYSYQTIFNGEEIFFNPDLPPTFIKDK